MKKVWSVLLVCLNELRFRELFEAIQLVVGIGTLVASLGMLTRSHAPHRQ
jgi:hypothetical protein